MDANEAPQDDAVVSPVFSAAGAMPAASEMAWKTAYPNPDRHETVAEPGHGPSFSIAGVTPGLPEAAWRTAMPDPSRDTVDSHGHFISKVDAEVQAQLAHRIGILTPKAGTADAA